MSNRLSCAGIAAGLCLFTTLASPQQAPPPAAAPDPIASLVGQLTLDRYKATIKSLTQFGDRRQGTDRNRAAIDWIETQLKSYGCTNTERLHYVYDPATAGAGRGGGGRGGDPNAAPGGARRRGYRIVD